VLKKKSLVLFTIMASTSIIAHARDVLANAVPFHVAHANVMNVQVLHD
jgi:hypothetical protein